MSQEPISIFKNEVLPKSMDFDFLRREGIRLAQELSGDIWTDYNDHDPGVTILEQLCFAITELGYKSDFPVEDLFFNLSNDLTSKQRLALYEAAAILPSAPLTVLDYRKLIIDRIAAVKNAWVLPKKQSTLGMNIRGLYEVLLQIEEEQQEEDVVHEVLELLRQERNLGEDFDSIRVLKPQRVTISGHISIDPNLEGETVLAHLLFELFEAFSPQIYFKSLEELQSEGLSMDQIYDGPLPSHGFIQNADLERSELEAINRLYKSGLIKIVSEVDGVVAVNQLTIKVEGVPVEKENFQLSSYSYPVLDVTGILSPSNALQLLVGDIPYVFDEEAVRYSFNILVAKYKQQFRKLLSLETPLPEPSRRQSEILHYYSMQESFPRIYGISSFGIPGKHTSERVAQARQLKGYLMLFEQHFLNFLAQLGHIGQLFTLDEQLQKTYFSQIPATIPDVATLLGKEAEELEQELEQLMQQFDQVHRRRHGFLDHLLARFGEHFLTDSFNAINRQASIFSRREFEKTSIDAKISFLKNYQEISRNRGKGISFQQGKHTVSGLKKKISLLFSINDYERKELSGISQDKRIKLSKKKAKEENSSPTSGQFTFKGDSEALLSEVLTYGTLRNNYQIVDEEKGFAIVFQHPLTRKRHAIYSGKNVEECEAALEQLIDFLRSKNTESEGFHLLEHILLRPVDLRFQFYLRDSANNLLQTDFIFPNKEEGIREFADLLRQLGGDSKNYKVSKQKNNQFRVELLNKQGTVIAHISKLLLQDSTQQAIKTTTKLIKELSEKGEDALLAQIGYHEQAKAGANLRSDPYSQQMTVLLPKWPARFSNQKLRILFEGIIRLHAPAHLQLNCVWLGMQEMREFEEVWHQWLDVKAMPFPAQPLLDDLSLYLLYLLLSYRSDDPNASIVQEGLPELRKRFG